MTLPTQFYIEFLPLLSFTRVHQHHANTTMLYRDSLNHWAVVCLLPDMQRSVVQRFRNPSDADGYVKTLRRLVPQKQFIVVFNPYSVND